MLARATITFLVGAAIVLGGGDLPTLIDLDDSPDNHHIVAALAVTTSAVVIAVDRHSPFRLRLRATVALVRAYQRFLAGTGAPFAWVIRPENGSRLELLVSLA